VSGPKLPPNYTKFGQDVYQSSAILEFFFKISDILHFAPFRNEGNSTVTGESKTEVNFCTYSTPLKIKAGMSELSESVFRV